MKKAIALDKVIFFEKDKIIHKRLGYSATIEKVLSRGNAIISIPNTPENRAIWGCLVDSKGGYKIKAQNVVTHFKHDIFKLAL